MDRTYVCIDLKSFYASVECVERGLDPLTSNLVVADESRTERTICLAVSPALKQYGIPGRPRLFEVLRRVKNINGKRLQKAPGHQFSGKSVHSTELDADPSLELDFVIAQPRMSLYIKYSTDIYQIYLRYIAPEDIHVYSVDEVFMDVTEYLGIYRMSAHELAMKMIHEILNRTGITATCGIGTNLYLGKIAMDIVAKHMPADKDGVRIASLDEQSYRRLLWSHRPLTDFWRVGPGYARKLEAQGLATMGDIARCSIGKADEYYNEDLLYRMFGVNAELLIDHAWGWESCTMADIKAYRSESSSMGAGQVLPCPYDYKKAKVVVREMAEGVAMDLFEKHLTADQVVLHVSYDSSSLEDPQVRSAYHGKIKQDYYGREVPEHAHGSCSLSGPTSSAKEITEAALSIYRRTVNPTLLIRKIYIYTNHVVPEEKARQEAEYQQMDIFSYMSQQSDEKKSGKNSGSPDEKGDAGSEKERRLQKAQEQIRRKYGKNAILKGTDFEEGATAILRNSQIGGHRA